MVRLGRPLRSRFGATTLVTTFEMASVSQPVRVEPELLNLAGSEPHSPPATCAAAQWRTEISHRTARIRTGTVVDIRPLRVYPLNVLGCDFRHSINGALPFNRKAEVILVLENTH